MVALYIMCWRIKHRTTTSGKEAILGSPSYLMLPLFKGEFSWKHTDIIFTSLRIYHKFLHIIILNCVLLMQYLGHECTLS